MFFPVCRFSMLVFMKVFLVDTSMPAVSKLERALAFSGFSCEKHIFSGKFPDFGASSDNGETKGVLLLGHGLDVRVMLAFVRHCHEVVPAMPVVAVVRAGECDAIQSLLDAGIKDYLCMPVRLHELVTRVSLVVRQVYPSEYAAGVSTIGPFVFSRYPNRVTRDGKEIVLTAREFELASLLFAHIGQPLSRLTLEETVWPDNENELSRTVDTHVSRVRNKLGLHEGSGFSLQQVYGYGYRLVRR